MRAKISPFKPITVVGFFEYNYILRHMLTEDLLSLINRKIISLSGPPLMPQAGRPNGNDYQLKISNMGGVGDLAFNITLVIFIAPDFFHLNTQQIYDAQSTSNINGKQSLIVEWYTSSEPRPMP